MNIWQQLEKPISILAPMEDVTDIAFRRVIKICGRPDLFFTEFTNCEGLQSEGRSKVIHRLKYEKAEKPIIAQIWGLTPQNYYETGKLILDLGFDGVDINMGCPVKKVVKQGACSALIKKPELAKEIIDATLEGVKNKIPVSVKTRIGFDKIDTQEWIGFLLSKCRFDALTIHGRTVKEESKVPCRWGEIAKAVEIRNKLKSQTLIIGNGDIMSLKEGQDKVLKYGLDGFMVGRGVFKNPWIFNENVILENISDSERIKLLKYHLDLYTKYWENEKDYNLLKKFFKIYIHDFSGASFLRADLMNTNNTSQARQILDKYLQTNL
jgi:nifR3 family TIM-barrel protein